MSWCYILLETYGRSICHSSYWLLKKYFRACVRHFQLTHGSWKLEQTAGWSDPAAVNEKHTMFQSKAKWKRGHLARDPSSSQSQSWSDLCKEIINSTAPKILRSVFWRKLRDAVLSWRVYRPSRWGRRSRAAPMSLKARSTNWGGTSWGRTMNWKLLKTETSKRSTSWNGLLLQNTLSQLIHKQFQLSYNSSTYKLTGSQCSCCVHIF